MGTWLQASFSHPAALIALIIKLTAVTMWAAVFRKRLPDSLTVWLHSWLAIQIFSIVVIMGASLASALTGAAMWVLLLFVLASSIVAYLVRGARFETPPLRVLLVAAVIGLPLALWAVRSMVLADYTLDSQTYGTVRIALWMNYRSVFVHMPTVMVNIFADEWNGELNGLVYALVASSIQGAMMGNVEILIVATLASVWLARRFGAGQIGSMLIGLLVATSPAFVGLASVTKGDLLSCAGVIMAIGMLERPTIRAVCVACIWFALAAGAKISVSVGAVLVMAVSLAPFWHNLRSRQILKYLGVTVVLSAILLARFIANLIIFRNGFLRVDAEAAEPGLKTLIRNLSVIGERFIGFFPIDWQHNISYSDTLSAGLGAAGWLAVLGVYLARGRRRPEHGHLVVLSAISIIATAYLIPPRIWGFRYFLPFVGVILIFCLVMLLHAVSALRKPGRYAALLGIVLVSYADFAMCFTPGPLKFALMMNEAVGKSAMDVALIRWPFWADEINPAQLGLDSGRPKRIAILNDMGAPVLIFVGSSAQNRVYLTTDETSLSQTALAHDADLAVISKAYRNRGKSFDIPGYRWVVNGPTFAIAARIVPREN
jgi:hypothetical protein